MARTRRTNAANKRKDAKEARQILPGKRTRLAYHSKSKNEVTVRTVELIEAKRNKRGGLYLVVMDLGKNARRNLTPDNIGWAYAV